MRVHVRLVRVTVYHCVPLCVRIPVLVMMHHCEPSWVMVCHGVSLLVTVCIVVCLDVPLCVMVRHRGPLCSNVGQHVVHLA